MGVRTKTFAVAILSGACLVWLILLIGPVIWSAVTVGYPLRDRDWNTDGETTFAEFSAAVDVGARPLMRDHQRCTDYFSFKDGLTIRIVCL
jgi:hypothetical protein